MARKKEAAGDDYYILFRDATVPTPLTRKERNKQREVMLTDRATYVWGYVGKLHNWGYRVCYSCVNMGGWSRLYWRIFLQFTVIL